MAGQCRKSVFCACAACALDREGGYMTIPSSKQCKCGCTDLVLLRSQNLKLCPDCKAEIHWPLTEGQKPLL